MYERSYGYRYEEAERHSSPGEIAKLVRRDIKQAISEGLLPARWTYSVRSDHLSISVSVLDCLDAWEPCDGVGCRDVWCSAQNDPAYAHGAKPHEVLTADAEAAKITLERIHGAYNHDGSEIQTDYFDVRYYGGVDFEDAHGADFRKRETARLAAKKASRETGEIVAKVINFGRERAVVHVLVETPEGKQVLGCGAHAYAARFSRANDAAEVTCSRCARRVRS